MSAFQWLVFAVLPLVVGCTNGAEPETVPLRSLAKGNFSGFTEAKSELIETKTDWERAWAKLSVRLKDADKVPAVDFTKEMVILITMGRQQTGGYSLEITKAQDTAGKLQIYVKRREPAPGAYTLQVLTAPFHAVALPKSGLKLEFIEVKADAK